MLVYGVFERPHYIREAREVESVWNDQALANNRALHRSYQVHGEVVVVSWELNSTSTHRVLETYIDGEPVRAPQLRR